jgi:hypothetical protein
MNYWWLLTIIPYLIVGILFLRYSGMGDALAMITYGTNKHKQAAVFYGAFVLWPLLLLYFLWTLVAGFIWRFVQVLKKTLTEEKL